MLLTYLPIKTVSENELQRFGVPSNRKYGERS